jgi:ABC-type branched-subunit amino acid transport system permease subunit
MINFSCFEELENLYGKKIRRIKSSVFYVAGLFAIAVGVFLLVNDKRIGIAMILTLAPCLFLYPLVRFFLGGRDSVFGVIATFIIEEVLKAKISSALKNRSSKKDRFR